MRGLIFGLLLAFAGTAVAQDRDGGGKGPSLLSPRGPAMLLPMMDAARGRRLFVEKGCVVCHAVNGVGGGSGPALDAAGDQSFVGPFDFAARMLRGAESMIALQRQDLGYRIDLTGSELADLAAFASDRNEQRRLSQDDIPPDIRRMMKFYKL